MDKKRKTLGELSTELAKKDFGQISVRDQSSAMLTDYEKNMFESVEEGKKKFIGSFFIVVITKKERILQNVIRNYFVARVSCPTPDYDQIVYKYNNVEDKIEFIWVVPSKHTCLLYLKNAKIIDPKEYALLMSIVDFSDGTLYKKCKKLNKEEDNSNMIVN